MELSKEKYESIVWGGIYEAIKNVECHCLRGSGGEQRYKFWIPAYNEKNDEVYMINTYQLSSPSIKEGETKLEAILRNFKELKEKGSWVIGGCSNYCYDSRILLKDYIFEKFELIGNLEDYETISSKDSEAYSNKDVINNVKLYYEHAWPNGITLVRKNAKKDGWNAVEKSCSDLLEYCKEPYSNLNSYTMNDLEQSIKYCEQNNLHYNKRRTNAVKEYLKQLDKISKEWKEIKKQLEDDLYSFHDFEEEAFLKNEKFERANIKLCDIHPDMERYLKEDCYCPGEIYNPNGFYYRIYKIDDKISLIGSNNGNIYVVCSRKDKSAQILVFETNKEKISDAYRIDATENNFQYVREMIESGHSERKINWFIH